MAKAGSSGLRTLLAQRGDAAGVWLQVATTHGTRNRTLPKAGTVPMARESVAQPATYMTVFVVGRYTRPSHDMPPSIHPSKQLHCSFRLGKC